MDAVEMKFTWLPKFTQTLLSVPEEHQAALFRALAQYGNYGTEPEFDNWALRVVFEALREDIDNNKKFRSDGASGGRGNKKRGKAGQEGCESPLSEGANPPSAGSGTAETPLCDEPASANPPLGSGVDAETLSGGGLEKPPSIPYQSIPGHTNPDQPREKGRRFTPPTVEEVRAWCSKKRYTFDPEAFHAFYESKGWKVGRNPMKSWQAACVTWQKRQGGDVRGGGDEYSNL